MWWYQAFMHIASTSATPKLTQQQQLFPVPLWQQHCSSRHRSYCFIQQAGPAHLSPEQSGSACLIRRRLVWKEQLVLEKKRPGGIIDPSQLSPLLSHIYTLGCDLWNYCYAGEICFWGALSAPQCAVKTGEETQWNVLNGRRSFRALASQSQTQQSERGTSLCLSKSLVKHWLSPSQQLHCCHFLNKLFQAFSSYWWFYHFRQEWCVCAAEKGML